MPGVMVLGGGAFGSIISFIILNSPLKQALLLTILWMREPAKATQ